MLFCSLYGHVYAPMVFKELISEATACDSGNREVPLSPSYPFAVVGIHLAGLLHSWLKQRTLSRYLYTANSQWPLTVEDFHEMFSESGL